MTPGIWATDEFAQWIAPQADIVGIPGVGVDTFYTYQTTFDLSGFDPSTVALDGSWTADNYISQVSLNGIPVFSYSGGCGSPGNWVWSGTSPFSITSGFVSGINTLSFNVTNDACANTPPHANPTGLLVDISGTGAPASAPEPGNALPVAVVGLGLAAWFYRRKVSRQTRVQ